MENSNEHKKLFEKALAVFLAIVMMFGILPNPIYELAGKAVAAELAPHFEYVVNEDGTSSITSFVGEETFIEVPSYNDSSQIKDIGANTFANNKAVVNVHIDEGITEIGDNVFTGCEKLKYVFIPSSVTKISPTAFDPSSKVTIYSYDQSQAQKYAAEKGLSFSELTSYDSVDITRKSLNDSISCILDNATGLLLIEGTGDMPDYTDNYYAGLSPFLDYIDNIENVILSEGIKSIGNYTFDNLEIKSVSLPESLITIGKYAFRNNVLLSKLKLPSNLKNIREGAFQSCRNLSGDLIIPDSVRGIDISSFEETGFDGKLVLGKNVRFIEQRAFKSCDFTGELIIPEKTTIIYDEAFSYCPGFTGDLTIDKNVYFIGKDAFEHCTGFNGKLSISNAKKKMTVKDGAFRNCTGFKAIELGEGIETIAPYTFYGCTGVGGKLVIPDCVKTVQSYAFDSMKQVSRIVVGSGVTELSNNAFYEMYNVKEITFKSKQVPGAGVNSDSTAIAPNQISPLTQLKKIYVPKESMSEYTTAYAGCSDTAQFDTIGNEKEFVEYDGVLIDYNGAGGDVVIPETVTAIGPSAFQNCTTITSVKFHDKINSIGSYAFAGCSGLTGTLTLPANLSTLGNYAFAGCSGLTGTLDIPSKIGLISYSAFRNCKGITCVNMKDGVSHIDGYAFAGCSGLKGGLRLPKNLDIIGEAAFKDCSNISGILNVPEGVTEIGTKAFEGVSGVTEVILPLSLVKLGDQPFNLMTGLTTIKILCVDIPKNSQGKNSDIFSGIAGLKTVYVPKDCYNQFVTEYKDDLVGVEIKIHEETSTFVIENGKLIKYNGNERNVTIPDDVTVIGAGAFEYRNDLESITFGKNVKTVDELAFYGCTNLINVKLNEGLESIGDTAFADCNNLSVLNTVSSLTTIGKNAFANCYHLDVDISGFSKLKTIGSDAFSCNTSLSKINIPSSVETIGDRAFEQCSSATELTIAEGVTTIGHNAFRRLDQVSGKIVLPKSLKTIGDFVFVGSDGITELELLGENVLAIRSIARMEGLTKITFNTDVKDGYNDYNIFSQVKSLTTVSVPSKFVENYIKAYENENIAQRLILNDSNEEFFIKNDKLILYNANATDVVIPENIKVIGRGSFKNYKDLNKVSLSDNVTNIENNAFNGCDNLSDVKLSNNLTTIGIAAFAGDKSLKSVKFNDKLERIEASAFASAGITGTLTFPQNLTYIGDYAFYGAKGISGELIIPDKVTYVGYNAFSELPAVNKIVVGSSVATIGSSCFNKMTGVKEIVFKGAAVPKVTYDYPLSSVVAQCENLEKIIVPSDSYDLYAAAIGKKVGNAYLLTSISDKPVEDLKSESVASKSIRVSWSRHRSTDITTYVVERDGVEIARVNEPTFLDRTATPETEHVYNVYGVAENGFTTKKASTTCKTVIFKLTDITTNNEYNSIGKNDTKVFIGFEGSKNLKDLEGKDIVGKLYYTKDQEKILIGKSSVGYKNGKDCYVVECDFNALNAGEYNVVFEISDIDGTVAKSTGKIIVDKGVPEKIVNFLAYGDVDSITLSWGRSSEVTSTKYLIYRKSEAEDKYTLIKTIVGRDTVSFIDTTAKKDTTYLYYIVTENIFGVQSEPSEIIRAKRELDVEPPRIIKIEPNDMSFISEVTQLVVKAEDNSRVTLVKLYYSVDDGEKWIPIGESDHGPAFVVPFDTTNIPDGVIKVKALAYDARNNESQPMYRTYSIDNGGPEKVTGVKAKSVYSTKIVLEWNEVTSEDAGSFVLEQKVDGKFVVISQSISTLGYELNELKPDTEYVFRVAAMDMQGNLGEYSDEVAIRTLKDTIAPVVTHISPGPGVYNKFIEGYISASDDYGIAKAEVQCSTDRKTWTTIAVEEYSEISKTIEIKYNLDLEGYAEGSIFVRGVVTDIFGNVSDTSDKAPLNEFKIDKTAPENPDGLNAVGAENWIVISWSRSSQSDIYSYSLYRSTNQEGPYELIASDLRQTSYYDEDVKSDTVYYYKLRVKDLTGNISDFSQAVSAVKGDDKTAPVIYDVYPTDKAVIGPSQKTIHIFATDNSQIANVLVEYKLNNEVEYKVLKNFEGGVKNQLKVVAELPIEDFSDGDKVHIRVSATDIAGIKSEKNVEYTYSVDKAAPTISDILVENKDGSVSIKWSDAKSKTDSIGYNVYRLSPTGSETMIASRSASSSHEYTVYDNLKGCPDGDYSYKISAHDAVGNVNYYMSNAIHYEEVIVNNPPRADIIACKTMELNIEDVFDAGRSSDDGKIVSYHWDFGDGTTSDHVKAIKKYSKTGTYKVVLTVTDDKGASTTAQTEVTVTERTQNGIVNIRIVDDSNNPVAYAPVYIDLGEKNQEKLYADGNGNISVRLTTGYHMIGVYKDGYLPLKQKVYAIANSVKNITLSVIKQEIVTGEFEVRRMSYDEIIDAGINVNDPANQNVYSGSLQISYSAAGKPGPHINYIRNDNEVIWWGFTRAHMDIDSSPNEGITKDHKVSSVEYIPNKEGKEIIAVVEVPLVKASYLKEFFDVKLHIMNNAEPEFELVDSKVHLNVPAGLTLMSDLSSSEWSNSPDVNLDTIKGQETRTCSWVLRGDREGKYNLTADFDSTLAVFNEHISAKFETKEPIEVFGFSNTKFKINLADTIEHGRFNCSFTLANTGPIDIYCPQIDVSEILSTAAESTSRSQEDINEQMKIDSNISRALVINTYIKHKDGTVTYLPYDMSDVPNEYKILAPGEEYTNECVVLSTIKDTGEVYYFQNAVFNIVSGYSKNVEITHADLPSYSGSGGIDSSETLEDMFKVLDYNCSPAPNEKLGSGEDDYIDFYKFEAGGITGKSHFLYDDTFFYKPAEEKNEALMNASIHLAGTAYNKEDIKRLLCGDGKGSSGSTSAEELKKAYGLGFKKLKQYNYEASMLDSVAYSFAIKEIETKDEKKIPLVAVVIRGTEGDAEWKSNFNFSEKRHDGFENATEELMESFDKYIEANGINLKNAKLWITGHSRGAAVANIMGTILGSEERIPRKNTYVYTFASPRAIYGDRATTEYTNIWNVCNMNDIVTEVPLDKWGFGRSGLTIPFNFEWEDEKGEAMRTTYALLAGHPYIADRELFFGSALAHNLTDDLTKVYPTPADFFKDTNKVLNLCKDIYENRFRHYIYKDWALNYTELALKISPVLYNVLKNTDTVASVASAHDPKAYIAYTSNLKSENSIYTQIKIAQGSSMGEFKVKKSNALRYLLQDENFAYFANSKFKKSELEKVMDDALRSVYDKLNLLLSGDGNVLTKEDQKKMASDLLLHLISNEYVSDMVDLQVIKQYTSAISSSLKIVSSIYNTKGGEVDLDDPAEFAQVVLDINSNEKNLKKLAKALEFRGPEGLQEEIMYYVGGRLSAVGLKKLNLILREELSYSNTSSALFETVSEGAKLGGKVVTLVNAGVDIMDSAAYGNYVTGVLRTCKADYAAKLILRTIIADLSNKDTMLFKEIANFLLRAYPGIGLVSALDNDVDKLVKDVAESFLLKIESNTPELISELAQGIKSTVVVGAEVAVPKILSNALNKALGKANVWLALLSVGYGAVKKEFHIDEYIKSMDAINIVTVISISLVNTFANLSGAYKGKVNVADINRIYGTNFVKSKEQLGEDSLIILKAICDTRLAGEEKVQKLLRENYSNIFVPDSKQNAECLRKCNLALTNGESETKYNTVDAAFSEMMNRILNARDAIFRVHKVKRPHVPKAPDVSFNYETSATNEKFSSNYEYCLSDGIWHSCDGETIKVPLKTVPQVLRVRQIGKEGSLSGKIKTINILARKKVSPIIDVKYDNGKFIFKNTISDYTYEAYPVNSMSENIDWTKSVSFVGGANASITAKNTRFVALRTKENLDRCEAVSEVKYLTVKTRKTLELETWGSGTVTQTNPDGKYFIGDEIILTAKPNANSTFDGWYINGSSVGKGEQYSLQMQDGIKVEARFKDAVPIAVESINITGIGSEAYENTIAKLKCEFTPSNAANKSISWKSSNDEIAHVNADGSVNFKAAGPVTISATSNNGVTKSVNINVKKNGVTKVFEVASPNKLVYNIGENLDLTGLVVGAMTENGDENIIDNYTVTVTDIEAAPAKTARVFKAKLSSNDLNTDYNVTCGKKLVRVAYENSYYEFEITVNHNFRIKQTVESNCDTQGYTIYECASCGFTYKSDYVDPKGHEFVEIKELAPDCSHVGYTAGKYCTVCNKWIEGHEEIPAIGHKYGAWEVIKEPTCSETGIKKRTCATCGEFELEGIPKTEHKHVKDVPEQKPSCGKPGYTAGKYCEDCKTWISGHEEIPAIEHSFGEWKVVKAATCTQPGIEERVCANCGEKQTREIAPIGHKHATIVPQKRPTCTTPGYTSGKYCPDCGTWLEGHREIPALGHDYSEWTVIKAPTCTQPGLKQRTCLRCNEKEEAVIDPINHKNVKDVAQQDPTCTKEGYTAGKYCPDCDTWLEGHEKIPALGHKFGEWTVIKAPTCTQSGLEERVCSVCGEKETREIAPTNHKNVKDVAQQDATCTEIGYTAGKYCPDCDTWIEGHKEIPALGHAEGEWVITVKPTTTTEGTRVKYCTRCGIVIKTETIPVVKNPVSSVTLNTHKIKLKSKQTAVLSATINPSDAAGCTVTWSTSNSSIAAIDQNGKITAGKKGSATIVCTVTDMYGNKVTDTCTVNVRYTFSQWIGNIFGKKNGLYGKIFR